MWSRNAGRETRKPLALRDSHHWAGTERMTTTAMTIPNRRLTLEARHAQFSTSMREREREWGDRLDSHCAVHTQREILTLARAFSLHWRTLAKPGKRPTEVAPRRMPMPMPGGVEDARTR